MKGWRGETWGQAVTACRRWRQQAAREQTGRERDEADHRRPTTDDRHGWIGRERMCPTAPDRDRPDPIQRHGSAHAQITLPGNSNYVHAPSRARTSPITATTAHLTQQVNMNAPCRRPRCPGRVTATNCSPNLNQVYARAPATPRERTPNRLPPTN